MQVHSLSLNKIYDIRNDLRTAYFKNKDNSKVIMNDDILRYTSHQDSTKHIVSISFNKQNEELLMINKKAPY